MDPTNSCLYKGLPTLLLHGTYYVLLTHFLFLSESFRKYSEVIVSPGGPLWLHRKWVIMLTVLRHWRACRRRLSLGWWINCRGFNWFPWLSITTERFQWRHNLADEREAGMDRRDFSVLVMCIWSSNYRIHLFSSTESAPIRGLGRLSPSTMVNWNALLWVRLESDHWSFWIIYLTTLTYIVCLPKQTVVCPFMASGTSRVC